MANLKAGPGGRVGDRQKGFGRGYEEYQYSDWPSCSAGLRLVDSLVGCVGSREAEGKPGPAGERGERERERGVRGRARTRRRPRRWRLFRRGSVRPSPISRAVHGKPQPPGVRGYDPGEHGDRGSTPRASAAPACDREGSAEFKAGTKTERGR
ncbi:hypothetical protein SKAU_G00363320 [Synaphobranchus kaupii]|uniref:Uncharacterized protein n=1 Tax=Synaphobranchus kaupii TaxID=118154 RepID=A0A9Q1EIN2_SYNKA|nr:hypothetical protein SKAU_G00363320 [Synaphobranchus kaupii]